MRELVPKFQRHRRAGGSPHRGIAPPNLPDEIWFVVRDQEDPLPALTALSTTTDLDGLYDLIEVRLAQLSWDHAELLNADSQARIDGVTSGRR